MKLYPYKNGKYSVYKKRPYHNDVKKWILEKSFQKFEKEDLAIKKKSRKRNRLYCFYLDAISCNATMKVSEVSGNYKFWRRINVFLTSLIKDYNLNSYKSSIVLHESGTPTIIPIAYWTLRTKGLRYKSYFLYENVDSELSVTELVDKVKSMNPNNKDNLIEIISDKHIALIKSIHAAKIRHDDPHGGNILTNIKLNDLNTINESSIKNAKFTLIDNDRCTESYIRADSIKKFFDIKCLTKFNTSNLSHTELIRKYFGEQYKTIWVYVFRFWNSGGFSLKKRIYYILKIKHLYQ